MRWGILGFCLAALINMKGNLFLWIIRRILRNNDGKQTYKIQKDNSYSTVMQWPCFNHFHIWKCKLPPKPHSSMFIVKAWERRRWLVAKKVAEAALVWWGIPLSSFRPPAAWLCPSTSGLYFLTRANSCCIRYWWWPWLLLLLQLCLSFCIFFLTEV